MPGFSRFLSPTELSKKYIHTRSKYCPIWTRVWILPSLDILYKTFKKVKSYILHSRATPMKWHHAIRCKALRLAQWNTSTFQGAHSNIIVYHLTLSYPKVKITMKIAPNLKDIPVTLQEMIGGVAYAMSCTCENSNPLISLFIKTHYVYDYLHLPRKQINY